ncbi:hypothetical protein Ocin01_05894 [Orchesella cincta]|uniref:Uncharacterized protein n=1 Tax=Orchesella cincta TaxID=48709 RepID=A0A1D2N6E0_ORCCI|nr:hypothetical protein Ocin01_05894 [Orchesella cincta]
MEDDQPMSKKKKKEPERRKDHTTGSSSKQNGKEQARPPSRRLSYVSDHNFDELLELGLCSKCGEGYHSGVCKFTKQCGNDEGTCKSKNLKEDEPQRNKEPNPKILKPIEERDSYKELLELGSVACKFTKQSDKDETSGNLNDDKPQRDKEHTPRNSKLAGQHPGKIEERDSYKELLQLGADVCNVPSRPFNFNKKAKAPKVENITGFDQNPDVMQTLDGKMRSAFLESASTICSMSITSGNASQMVNTALQNSMRGNEPFSNSSDPSFDRQSLQVEKPSSSLNVTPENLENVNDATQLTASESIVPADELASANQSVLFVEKEPEKVKETGSDSAEVEQAQNYVEIGNDESLMKEEITTPNVEVGDREDVHPNEGALSITQVKNHPFHVKVTTDQEIEVTCTKTSKHTIECTVTTTGVKEPLKGTPEQSELPKTSDADVAITVIKHSQPVSYSASGLSTTEASDRQETLPSVIEGVSSLQQPDQIIQQTENELCVNSNSKQQLLVAESHSAPETQELEESKEQPSHQDTIQEQVNEVPSHSGAPEEIQMEQVFMQTGQEEQSTFSIMMNMDDLPEQMTDMVTDQNLSANQSKEGVQENEPSPHKTSEPSLIPPAQDDNHRDSGQLSTGKIAHPSDDILVLVEYNTEHFEVPHVEMQDESLSVRTSYLMSGRPSLQADPSRTDMDESVSVRTSYLMSKRSSVQAGPTTIDESTSARTSYLMSQWSSAEVDPTSIDESFPMQLDTIVEQPINISNSNLEPDNVQTLQPITTEVFNTMAPSEAIEIRQVQHQNSPAAQSQSDMHSVEQHNEPTVAEVQVTESHKEEQPQSHKRHKRRIKKGEGFLDLEYSLPAQETVSVITFYETTSASEVSEGEFENEETKEELRSRIIEQAEEIKRLVSEKRMGLPQVHSEHILSLADEIISNHTKSANTLKSDKLTEDGDVWKSKQKQDKTDSNARNIINIADRSEGILDKFKSTKEYKDNVRGGEATEHLSKMIKKLHCRHRQLRRLAEEIIAKRWKLLNLGSIPSRQRQSKSSNMEARTKDEQHKKNSSRAQKRLRRRAKRKKKSKSIPPKQNALQTLYTNPMSRVKEVGVRAGKETWKEGDPLWKAVNKVGVERAVKCSTHTPTIRVEGSDDDVIADKKRRKFSNSGYPGHTKMSALSIFMSNISKVTVGPSKTIVFDSKQENVRVGSIRLFNVDASKLTSDFVDQWKRRSYGIGILCVILTALTHSVYICGPRMGDNYVTYTMTSRLSGPLYLAPTGIFGIIFLGYVFGGMAVIKTAAATAHDTCVKDYYKKRKKKYVVWYALTLYYFVIWLARSIMWFAGLEKTEKEIRGIFKNTFYYSQLPSRLMYTQFLFSCCGADGPDDYKNANKIGYPKTCFVGVKKFEDYFSPPSPVQYGCVVEVYRYSAYAMAVICGLSLIVWLLIVSISDFS